MFQTLDELVQYVRRTVPQPKLIKHMIPDEKAGVVIFEWQSRKFAVRKSLEVFEVKNNRIFVTGASGLMQAALTTKNRNQSVINTIIETLQQVEGQMRDNQPKALALLDSVKKTLQRQIGK